MTTIEMQPSAKILLTYRSFPYKNQYAVAELIDNSTQSFYDNESVLDPIMRARGERFEVRIHYDSTTRTISIWDNAMGMDLTDIQRAIRLAEPPPVRTGRSEFGMGLKTAATWMGDTWQVTTKKAGSNTEYSFTVDVPSMTQSGSMTINVVEKQVHDTDAHYTLVEIRNMHRVFRKKTENALKRHLASMYRHDLRSGKVSILWNDESLAPEDVKPLVTTNEAGEARTWRQDVEFSVDGMAVRGYICILEDRGRKNAGFDLIRRNRVIVGRPGGWRPENIFGDQRNDLLNQRLYGELHLDEFPVNHLKDDFQWDDIPESFWDELASSSAEYKRFAQEFRPSKEKQHVPEEVAQDTDEAVAEDLTNEDMINRITILEDLPPAAKPDPTVRQQELEILRQQSRDPKKVTFGKYSITLYHPQRMVTSEPYVMYQCPEANAIDVFINDNHPFVTSQIRTPDAYQAYVKTCVFDVLATFLLTRMQKPVDPEQLIAVKHQLMSSEPFRTTVAPDIEAAPVEETAEPVATE